MDKSKPFYNPRHFRETDSARLYALIRKHPFATLITVEDSVPVVSHLPFILNEQSGTHGTLYGHMARANRQWQTFAEEQEVLVIFHGPHAYVTPSWYAEDLNVPTWNYAVVHAYGRPRIFEDMAEFYRVLSEQVQTYEAPFAQPWQFTLPDDFVQQKMLGVVCFALEITRLEGKFKLSQNRPEEDPVHVAAMLEEDAETREVSELMRVRESQP